MSSSRRAPPVEFRHGRRRFLLGSAAAAAAEALPARAASERTLRVAFPVAESGFDPVQSQDLYSGTIIEHLFDAPLRYDPLARPALLRPNTAAALPEYSPDYRTLTIRLRPGIYFADHPAFGGRPRELTAHDYVYSWKRIFDPRWKSQNLHLVEGAGILGLNELRAAALRDKRPFDYDVEIDGLRALDRYTLQLRFADPQPRFHQLLAAAQPFGAVAREVVEAHGEAIAAHPVGTGPFRLAHWRRSSRIVLERNPRFRPLLYEAQPPAEDAQLAAEVRRLYGRRLPLVERVEVSIIEEAQPRWLAFLQGELDLLALPGEFQDIAAPGGRLAPFLARRGVRLQRTPLPDLALTYFNLDHPMVGGYTPERVALRRAVALAFDEDEYVRLNHKGQAIVAQSPFVPNTYGYDPAFVTPISAFDRAAARALLDVYGYLDRDGDGWREQPDGSPLALEIAATPSQSDRRNNELWKRYLTAIGVRVSFRIAPWPELLKQSLAGKLMMWSFGWQAAQPDPDVYFGFGYSGNIEQTNDARFRLPAYDRLYERSRRLPDGPERLAVLREAARLLAAYMPYKFHVHRIANDLVQPWVIGYSRHPFTQRRWDTIDIDVARRASA
ncbi:MAG: ABC transporter substrate-binding protein [Sutterellaceae bacterium]|nr:ABC transporter substrate-binding protein [Burkholderiaceae bacterium]MDW8429676.1 ABC transporter substrate-binding protein [Sutterellaceae bacterium]